MKLVFPNPKYIKIQFEVHLPVILGLDLQQKLSLIVLNNRQHHVAFSPIPATLLLLLGL